MHLNWKVGRMCIGEWIKFMFLKMVLLQGVVCSCRGVYAQYMALGQSKPTFICSLKRDNKYLYNNPGQMTKMATRAINTKIL